MDPQGTYFPGARVCVYFVDGRVRYTAVDADSLVEDFHAALYGDTMFMVTDWGFFVSPYGVMAFEPLEVSS